MKRMKKIKRDKARGLAKSNHHKGGGNNNMEHDPTMDNFELFLTGTEIQWCYYRDTHRVLGSTVGMLILQDFEALTPNLMARTIETVEGGGLIIFLMRSVKSLKQLYTMSMDVHARYRTESAGDVVPRFNERFLLSLGKCRNCLVCDDELNVLPLSQRVLKTLGGEERGQIVKGDTGEVLTTKSQEDVELEVLKESLRDTPHVGVIVDLTKTMDQAKAVLTFLEACSEKQSKSTVALTAGRGRGKSAAIGLCLAGAISFGYSTINVTAPEPENLVAVFDFVIRGLKALKYQEHLDYTITYHAEKTGREAIKCVIAVEIHKSHRQSIRYVKPEEKDKFASAELVAIDEAAAIPLPIVRALMGDRLTFMSSTVNGYEGTGRALSLKLIKELRDLKGRGGIVTAADSAATAIAGPQKKKGEAKVHEERWAAAAEAAAQVSSNVNAGPLREIELSTPIRYMKGDPVESWLNKLLCLDSGSAAGMKLVGGAPAPSDCDLYYVDRDALFSYHKLSESFLQKMMGLYSSAHYKNTPNDLQMLSDAPAHSIFVLLSPSAEEDSNALPDILAVVQVALEGKISRKAVEAQLSRGHRSAGDLIPWTISQQFGDSNFAQLSGARIVRVAVHPSVQGMGYGSRAIELLYRFYNGEMVSLTSNDSEMSDNDGETEEEEIIGDESDSDSDGETKIKKGIQGEKLVPRKKLPPLLQNLTDIKAPRLDWLGTSFGLTTGLYNFWKRGGMHLLYLRQTKNDLTGEHSAIMVRALPRRTGFDDAWLPAFVADTQRRIISLLSGPFNNMNLKLATSVLQEFDSSSNNRQDFMNNEDVNEAIKRRSGSSSSQIAVAELNYFLTPHDLKRIELYGRNLCDHHLVSDLLPSLARLYFSGRMGPSFHLSSLQGALLCGIGLQNQTVDKVTAQLGLPANQVLAMFNKGIRKISIALNGVVEEDEKNKLLGGKARQKAEKVAEKLKDVSLQTLEEDAREGATNVMTKLRQSDITSKLPSVGTDNSELMKFAIKGTNAEWEKALEGQKSAVSSSGMVQIQRSDGAVVKRKLNQDDIDREAGITSPKDSKKKKKQRRKSRK